LTRCRKLQEALRLPCLSLEEQAYSLELVQQSGLSELEASLWLGPAKLAQQAKHITIRGIMYRTKDGDERYVTQDSGVALTLTSTESTRLFGNILEILEVNFGGNICNMLRVGLFKECKADTELKGTYLVRQSKGGNYNPCEVRWVEASKIDGQVFFAAHPESKAWLHVFEYKSSGYVVPPHHFDASGRMLDI
jgi:hypothetical protein